MLAPASTHRTGSAATSPACAEHSNSPPSRRSVQRHLYDTRVWAGHRTRPLAAVAHVRAPARARCSGRRVELPTVESGQRTPRASHTPVSNRYAVEPKVWRGKRSLSPEVARQVANGSWARADRAGVSAYRGGQFS